MENQCRTILRESCESARPTVTLLIDGRSGAEVCLVIVGAWLECRGLRGQAQTPLASLGRSNAMSQATENHDRAQIN